MDFIIEKVVPCSNGKVAGKFSGPLADHINNPYLLGKTGSIAIVLIW